MQKEVKKERAVVDKVFVGRIYQILKIMVPRTFCKETGYLILIAIMLVLRTYCDIWMIHNGTVIESAIIGRSRKDFKRCLFNFIAAMPAISLVNNFLKYGLNELKLCFRVRLTKYLYEQYLQSYTFYKMGNLDNRIGNPDQLLTQDVEKFCNSVVDLYSNLSKPFLDIVLYIFKLTSAIGAQGPASMMAYLLFSGFFLTRLRRPIGKMTVTEQKYEGEYRYVNSRLITNRAGLKRVVEHLHNFILFRFTMGFVDTIIAKYLATVVGYLVVSRPFLNLSHPRHLSSTHAELLELHSSNYRINASSEGTKQREISTNHASTRQRFDHVPLATPNGDMLIKDLNFEVQSGANVLICGPNGCGKSSLFRVLGELWPLFGGCLTKPERGKLFYVPQVLKEYLDNVQLGQILEREGGWDSVQDWMDVLSGGEKQRMAMARLFYHKPQFAILDECTSAVSVDVEGYIYSHCRKVGITLFTVSHRKSLWKHHDFYLHMDGRGNYEFKKITEETVEFGS
ncbi:putative ATP-binding cassette sub-family D member 3 protein [Naja naja]|nr:putative ATP-binding cassette sub-family D member 3 protein [Naja naja]